MSFILDALKKLEQKRNQESVPDLLTVHSAPDQRPQRRMVWLSMVVLALCINAGILLAWLKPWQPEKQTLPDSVSSVQPELTPSEQSRNTAVTDAPHISPNQESSANSSVSPENKIQSLPQSSPVTAHLPEAEPPVKEKVTSASAMTLKSEPGVKVLSDEPEHSDARSFLPGEEEVAVLRAKIKEEIDLTADTAPEESTLSEDNDSDIALAPVEVVDISQLPSELKNELPKIAINTHIYSNNPSSRVVNINGIVLREGDDIARGLTLEEITTSGVILTFRDHRFRIRAF